MPGRRGILNRGHPGIDSSTERRAAPVRSRRKHTRVLRGPRASAAVFRSGGSITAGNSSPLNDGAAALLLTTREGRSGRLGNFGGMERWGLGWCGPDRMGIGPVPATRKLMGRLGWEWNELDLVELNGAFAHKLLLC